LTVGCTVRDDSNTVTDVTPVVELVAVVGGGDVTDVSAHVVDAAVGASAGDGGVGGVVSCMFYHHDWL
jgi:hypothetical protein